MIKAEGPINWTTRVKKTWPSWPKLPNGKPKNVADLTIGESGAIATELQQRLDAWNKRAR